MTGVKFGKYYLTEHIAAGGMAEIYKAEVQLRSGEMKTVAIKRILPEYCNDDEFITLLVDEARIMVTLSHPNIVSLIEFGKVQDSYFIAFEYLDGFSIKEFILAAKKSGVHIPFHLTAYIFGEVMAGLGYAHGRKDDKGKELNIVHRDISPTNILIGYDGQVKIVDFGIAKAADQGQRTQVGIIRGKSGYMSPEQAWGKKGLDGRSDIYSAGIIMYEMLTLTRLFRSKDVAQSIKLLREAVVAPARSRNRNIPIPLETIAMKSLEKDLTKRYQTATAMQQDLKKTLQKLGKAEQAHLELVEYLQIIMPRAEVLDITEPQVKRSRDQRVVVTDRPREVELRESQHGELVEFPTEEIDNMFDDIQRDKPAEFEGSLEELFSEDSLTLLANKRYRNQLDFGDFENESRRFTRNLRRKKGLFRPYTLFLLMVLASVIGLAVWQAGLFPVNKALTIETDPPGAVVVFNQTVNQQRTPLTIRNGIKAGTNSLMISLDGYETIEQKIELSTGRKHNFHYSLRPAVKRQRMLAIYTTPPGASVTVNGQGHEGKTPTLLEDVGSSSEIVIELLKEGFEPQSRTVSFQGRQRFQKLDIVLIPSARKPRKIKPRTTPRKPRAPRKYVPKPAPLQGPGFVNLNSVPFSTVTIYRGKEKIYSGQTPVLKRALPAGDYRAFLKTNDGQKKAIRFSIEAGKNRKIQTVYFDRIEEDLLAE